MTRSGTIALGAVLLLAKAACAGAPEDDLALVKKALAQETRAPEEAARAVGAARRVPQWLRVRVVDKGAKKGKVSINLPLSLAHALGDDLPVDWHCRQPRDAESREGRKDSLPQHGGRCRIHLSEVLAALEAGQDLVEVDDDEATVRIWVE